MIKGLFKNFQPVTEKEWKQKIQVDLRGKDYNESMITSTDEGIDIKPFYHRDQNHNFEIPSPERWVITEKISIEDLPQTTQNGSESYWLSANTYQDISESIKSLESDTIVELKHFGNSEIHYQENLYLLFDPIYNLISSGNWIKNKAKDLEEHANYVKKTKTLSLDARLYHNSGANIVQQLGYTMSHFMTYLKNVESKKLKIVLLFAIGPNYFFEIAKIKAARLLINSICKANDIDYDLKIISEPGTHYMSIYDYNVNMLRSTSECMSAVLGGSDYIRNVCYDEIFKKENNFSKRIARNQLLILKHESYFNHVENITEGSYYINYIIKALSEKALALSKSIEKSGGFIQQLFDGYIQQRVKQQLYKSIEKFNNKELILVGVNQYVNDNDKMKNELEKEISFSKNSRKTIIEPLFSRRIAEELERKKLNEESL